MKCPMCRTVELRWVKGKRAVFCPECGTQMPNIDGKIKVVGRPPKAEASTDKQTSRAETQGS